MSNVGTRQSVRVNGTQGAMVSLDMYVLDCAGCGIIFAITTELEARRRRDGRVFYCPNKCLNSWHETEEDRQRKRAKEAEARAAKLRAEADQAWAAVTERNKQLQAEKRSHGATKGQLTKTRKRAAAALCPVDGCGRSFVQIRRHLVSKHPDYTPET